MKTYTLVMIQASGHVIRRENIKKPSQVQKILNTVQTEILNRMEYRFTYLIAKIKIDWNSYTVDDGWVWRRWTVPTTDLVTVVNALLRNGLARQWGQPWMRTRSLHTSLLLHVKLSEIRYSTKIRNVTWCVNHSEPQITRRNLFPSHESYKFHNTMYYS